MIRDVAILVPAAGRGHRFNARFESNPIESNPVESNPVDATRSNATSSGGTRPDGTPTNKLFAILAGRPLWRHTIDRFAGRPDVARIVMSVDEVDRDRFAAEIAAAGLPVETVIGGAERMDSVKAALQAIEGDDSVSLIAIHDAARPLVTDAEIDSVIEAARRGGAAFLGTPVSGSLHRRMDGSTAPVDRTDLFQAATPQVFESDLFRRAYQRHNGRPFTDDVQLVGRTGHRVEVVAGRTDNLKITFAEDLLVAEAILNARGV